MNEINISKNFLLLGMVLLLVGFIIMALGNDTYSFWKITVAPILLIAGYAVVAYSIMHRKSKTNVSA